MRLLGEVEVGARVLDLLRLLEVAHDLLEERQARQEPDNLLLRALDAVLLRRDCCEVRVSTRRRRLESAKEREDALRSNRSLARLYSSRSCFGGPVSRAEPSEPARPSTEEGRLPPIVKIVSRNVRLRGRDGVSFGRL